LLVFRWALASAKKSEDSEGFPAGALRAPAVACIFSAARNTMRRVAKSLSRSLSMRYSQANECGTHAPQAPDSFGITLLRSIWSHNPGAMRLTHYQISAALRMHKWRDCSLNGISKFLLATLSSVAHRVRILEIISGRTVQTEEP